VAQSNDRQIQGAGLTDDDIKLLDQGMIQAILACRTRSKIGQTPRFYLRIELNDNKTFLNDLRECIQFVPSENMDPFKVQKIDQFEIDIESLIDYLAPYKDRIHRLHIWQDQMIQIKNSDALTEQYKDKVSMIDPLKK